MASHCISSWTVWKRWWRQRAASLCRWPPFHYSVLFSFFLFLAPRVVQRYLLLSCSPPPSHTRAPPSLYAPSVLPAPLVSDGRRCAIRARRSLLPARSCFSGFRLFYVTLSRNPRPHTPSLFPSPSTTLIRSLCITPVRCVTLSAALHLSLCPLCRGGNGTRSMCRSGSFFGHC